MVDSNGSSFVNGRVNGEETLVVRVEINAKFAVRGSSHEARLLTSCQSGILSPHSAWTVAVRHLGPNVPWTAWLTKE